MINYTQLVEITIKSKISENHYNLLGYNAKKGDTLNVLLCQLIKTADVFIDVICDRCDRTYKLNFRQIYKRQGRIIKDFCDLCSPRNNSDRKEILDVLKIRFKKRNMELLDNQEYINAHAPLKYICLKHESKGIQTIAKNTFDKGQGCIFCGYESDKKKKYNIENVRRIFESKGCTLLSSEYKSITDYLDYICENGHTGRVKFMSFLQDQYCKECYLERNRGENHPNWQGGTTNISNFLRSCIEDWKRQSAINCGFQCILTKDRYDVIHHLYGFNFILQEVFKNTELPILQIISDYTEYDLENLRNECTKLHKKYGLGVCLRNDVHVLYHQIYGYGSNTPEQFEEFKFRYMNEEFEMSLEV